MDKFQLWVESLEMQTLTDELKSEIIDQHYINLNTLLNEVRHMRGLQKAYFKTRDKDTMKRAIETEKLVDKLLDERE